MPYLAIFFVWAALIAVVLSRRAVPWLRARVSRWSLSRAFRGAYGENVGVERFASVLNNVLVHQVGGTEVVPAACARAMKIRELYALLDPRSATGKQFIDLRAQTRCLVELGAIIKRLAPLVALDQDIPPRVVSARQILAFVGERRGAAVEQLQGKQIEAHFRSEPMSIEQLAEILILVVTCISYRIDGKKGVS